MYPLWVLVGPVELESRPGGWEGREWAQEDRRI